MANLFYKALGILLLGFWIPSVAGCGDLQDALTSLIVSPTTATVGISQSKAFSVIGRDSLGRLISVSPSWTVSGSIGLINSNGIFTASSNTAAGYVIATSGTLTSSASVTITDRAWIIGRVYDNAGHKVPDLKVYINSILFDFTDSNGDYSIASIPAGTYRVLTEQTSVYQPSSAEVAVASGETQIQDFTILYFTNPPELNPPEFNPEL